MKNIKWLVELAGTKPLLFCIAGLLMVIGWLGVEVRNLKMDLKTEVFERRNLESYYIRRMDSLSVYYVNREVVLNAEVKESLNLIIQNYQKQLDEQRQISREAKAAVNTNTSIIKQNTRKLKSLQNEEN